MAESIIDTSRPSAGRMYDYYLGGHHNFEVDRRAADHVMTMMPFAARFCRLQRWCLQDIAMELTEKRGFDVIVDFASGLPTNDHIHHVVPAGTTVIYSDYDPVVVEYAREILGETNPPNVHFFEADARRPDELLNRPAVQEILKGRRNVALVLWGVAAFMTAPALAQIAQTLYEWSGPRACLAFQAQAVTLNPDDPSMRKAQAIYEQMGSPFFIRSLDETIQLLQPWRPDEPGFVDLLSWHSLNGDMLSQEDIDAFGAAGGSYGSYLVK
jgi:hypothetical protein